MEDRPGTWREEPRSNFFADLVTQGSNNFSLIAEQRRTSLKNYFMAGAVPWQNERICVINL